MSIESIIPSIASVIVRNSVRNLTNALRLSKSSCVRASDFRSSSVTTIEAKALMQSACVARSHMANREFQRVLFACRRVSPQSCSHLYNRCGLCRNHRTMLWSLSYAANALQAAWSCGSSGGFPAEKKNALTAKLMIYSKHLTRHSIAAQLMPAL